MKDNKDYESGDGQSNEADSGSVMPEVTFEAFVMSLNSSVLYHLGEIPDPVTGKREHNLDLARHGIDTLSMMEEKTTGNLTDGEAKMLRDILYDAKMKYVQASK